MIRIFQKEEQEDKNANKVISDLVEKNIRVASVMLRATPIMEALTGLMIAGFIFFSGKLINSGELGLNNFFFFSCDDVSLSTHKIFGYNQYGGLPRSGGAKRIYSEIDKPIKIKNEINLPDLNANKYNINFKNISFKYETTEDKALNNVNLSFDGGKISALVGKSGAGKSTIINLLPRFYDPQNGEISIDGQDIKKINLKSLRKKFH